MNKRLEQELEEWNEHGPLTNIPWCTPQDAIAITAQHFYNLALEDVKKEVEKIKDYVEALKIDDDFHCGELAVCDNILDFIDQQSK